MEVKYAVYFTLAASACLLRLFLCVRICLFKQIVEKFDQDRSTQFKIERQIQRNAYLPMAPLVTKLVTRNHSLNTEIAQYHWNSKQVKA